jgi:hypothetical protein
MGLAMVTFFVYERPFLRLKRYFEYGKAAPRPAAAAPAT